MRSVKIWYEDSEYCITYTEARYCCRQIDSRAGTEHVSLFLMSRRVMGPTRSAIQWISGALSYRVRAPECEAGHLDPYSVEVKNGLTNASNSPYDFMVRDYLYFTSRNLHIYVFSPLFKRFILSRAYHFPLFHMVQ